MKTPKGNGTCQRIDGKALGWALAKAQITLDDVKAQNGHRLSEPGWNRMLAGFRAEPKSWLVICNLLGVPLNAFDLPAAGTGSEQVGRAGLGSLGRLEESHGAKDELAVLAALRGIRQRMEDYDLDHAETIERAQRETAEAARNELPGLLASVGRCLQEILQANAPRQSPRGAESDGAAKASFPLHGSLPASAPQGGIKSQAASKNVPAGRRVPSSKAATPRAANQATKPATA